MLINVNDKWRITSDERQFILQKYIGKSKNGEENWTSVGYHPGLGSLVRECAERELRGGGEETLAQALGRAENLVTDLSRALTPLLNTDRVGK